MSLEQQLSQLNAHLAEFIGLWKAGMPAANQALAAPVALAFTSSEPPQAEPAPTPEPIPEEAPAAEQTPEPPKRRRGAPTKAEREAARAAAEPPKDAPPSDPAPEPTPPAAEPPKATGTVTDAQLLKATTDVGKKMGRPKVVELLQKYSVARLSELSPENRAAMFADLQVLLKG